MRLIATTVILSLAGAACGQDLKDYTNTPLTDLGVALVKPTKDAKTGLLVGGTNETALIRKLTEINGRSIAELEKDMRPSASSLQGFLGKDEKLLDVLAMDNDFVLKHKLTHQELAKHLHVVAMIGMKLDDVRNRKPNDILYHGQRLRIAVQCYRGYQNSPFNDGTKTNCDAQIENLTTGKKVGYSMLVPFMIERYGFYEGKGTPYRVDPAEVLAVFPFLTAKK